MKLQRVLFTRYSPIMFFRSRSAFYIVGVLGFAHLLIHLLLRIVIYINPMSSYAWMVNAFTSQCYFNPAIGARSASFIGGSNMGSGGGSMHLPVASFWESDEDLKRHIHDAQLEAENYQVLLSGNRVYAADYSPARKFFSYERALMQPLIKETLRYHNVDSMDVKILDIIAEDFPGFGNVYNLIVERQSTNSLLRFTTFLPASPPEFFTIAKTSTRQHVLVVVPYYNQPERLEQFINFIKLLMNHDRCFSVHLVNQVPSSQIAGSSIQAVNDNLKKSIHDRLNTLQAKRFLVSTIEGAFSRGKAINYGARSSPCTNCTLFFCDVDIIFTEDMLNRCRVLAAPNYAAYFPMVFSQFNPDLSQYKVTSYGININRDSGFWRSFGYGMSCLHSSDFLKLDKIPEYTSWGSEDDKFHQIVVKSGLTIFRNPDPGLIHAYHSKDCSKVDSANRIACYKSKASVEGSSSQIGLEYFKLKYPTK